MRIRKTIQPRSPAQVVGSAASLTEASRFGRVARIRTARALTPLPARRPRTSPQSAVAGCARARRARWGGARAPDLSMVVQRAARVAADADRDGPEHALHPHRRPGRSQEAHGDAITELAEEASAQHHTAPRTTAQLCPAFAPSAVRAPQGGQLRAPRELLQARPGSTARARRS